MLLERDREIQLLTDLLAGTNAGGQVVLIRGEAGVGKTSLVRAFIDRATDEAHFVVGGCDDLNTPQPWAPFHDMARSDPTLARPLAAGDRNGLFEAAMELLSRRLQPTVMVFEDTQWAGDATLDAITYLGRRIRDTTGLLVLTYRDEEVDYNHPLRSVIGAIPPGSVSRIRLEGLSVDAVAVMLEGTAHDLATVMELTDGNPLFVAELAASHAGEFPMSIADAVLTKLARLSDQSRELLRVLSVIPEPVSIAWTRRLADTADELLAETAAGGLIDLDERVRFRHELVRRAVEASLKPAERIAANRAVLATLPPDTDPAQLAHHALEADDPAAVLQHVPNAAAAAFAVESYREAYRLYNTLEPHLGLLEPSERGELLDRFGHVAFRSFSPNEENLRIQQSRVEHHKKYGDPRAVAGALADLATIFTWAHRSEEAKQAASEALELLGPGAAPKDQLPALVALSHISMMDADIAGTRLWAGRALAAAAETGNEEMAIRSLVNLASSEDSDNYPGGAHLIDEAAERAIAIGSWWHARRAWQNHAWIAIEALDLPAATDYLQRALDARARFEAYRANNYTAATHAKLLEATGEWENAENRARDLSGYPTVFVSLPIVGAIEARTGRAAAKDTLTHAWRLTTEAASPQRTVPAGAALAEYAWISGDHEIPLDSVQTALTTGLETIPWWRSTGLIALWLWILGVLDKTPAGIADPYRLIIDGKPLEAAELFAEIGCPYEHAIALSHGPSESQLQALEELEDLGATAVVSKLRRQLGSEGVRLPRGRAHSTRSHVAGLTARQAEVLELIAEGLSNPEIADRLFVSPRTVEHHVSAILAKLDVTSRQGAVSRARSRNLITA